MHNFLELENGVAAPVRGMQMEWRDYHKCSQTILRNKPLQPQCSSASPQFQLSLHSGFPKQKAELGTVKDLLAVQKEIGLVLFKVVMVPKWKGKERAWSISSGKVKQ